jgi:hypothetical protein
MSKDIDKSMGIIRGTIASYKQINSNPICDVQELAEYFSENVGNIPEYVGFKKACEIRLLAKAFIGLERQYMAIKGVVSEELNWDAVVELANEKLNKFEPKFK